MIKSFSDFLDEAGDKDFDAVATVREPIKAEFAEPVRMGMMKTQIENDVAKAQPSEDA